MDDIEITFGIRQAVDRVSDLEAAVVWDSVLVLYRSQVDTLRLMSVMTGPEW